jgi:site-specific recombinase XerD
MARSVRARIETRSARLRLPGRKDPYWQSLERELAAGYHRPLNGGAGTWWGRVRLDGRYKIEALATADDHAEADGETVLNWAQAQAAIRAWAAKQTGTGPYTVAAACRDHVADLRARKGEKAAREADGRLKKHLLPKLGERRLADLTTADLIAWRNGLVDEDEDDEEELRRSRDTANRMRSIAFAAFNLAFNTGKVNDDRAWRRVKPFRDVGEARKVILTEAQQQNFADACEPDLREFALLVARTGARPGRELTDARVRDLELEAATLRVRGKTGEREIYLDPDALQQLRRLAAGKKPNDYLLTTATGTPWTKSLHSRRVAAAVEKAGLDPETTLYALRHSYISGALKKGADVGGIAKQCGTSIAMIQRYYGKWVPSDLAKLARKAAPKLRTDAQEKVVALRPGAA